MWVEGNELKALRIWKSAFPELSSYERIQDHFLPVVTGKKQLVGENEFTLEDDDTKYWDADRSGEPNESFPLLQSWEDVIKLKQVKLYIAEMELKQWRLRRRYPDNFENCGFNTNTWVAACDENRIENPMRKVVNDYYVTIKNLTRDMLPDDMYANMLPILEDDIPLLSGPTYLKKKELSSYELCKDAYDNMMAHLIPIRNYFKEKYCDKIFVFSDFDIENISGLTEERMNRIEWSKMKRYEDPDSYGKERIAAYIPAVSATSPLNVESFVKSLIKESERDTIKPEDALKTEWQSGYIDTKGNFYGCSNTGHVNLADEICEQFKFKIPKKKDALIILDEKKWMKFSMFRFIWDTFNMRPNKKQQKTMLDLMIAHGLEKTTFGNMYSNEQTFADAFSDDKEGRL